jgi:hypothetical protein
MTLENDHILKELNPQGLLHGILMTVGWVALQQIALWSLLYRNKSRKAIYIHAAAMLMLTLLVAIGATQIILVKGIKVIYKTWFHNLLGFIISCITPIAVALGFMARIL